MIKIEEKTHKVVSYCDLPKKVADTCAALQDKGCDCFVEYTVTSPEDQSKFDDDFALDNWLIKEHPELNGKTILIHIDY